MNDIVNLKIQEVELRDLVEKAGNDPILAQQLTARLDEVSKRLQIATRDVDGSRPLFPSRIPPLPRAAIFMSGESVVGSRGIRPALAGEAMIQYEKMYTEQALHDEREAAKTSGRQRRKTGSPTPGLMFTGTPRGSFGLEFVPQQTPGDEFLEVHARSLDNVATAITRVAGADDQSLEEVIQQIPSRVLDPLRNFLTLLSAHHAELRIAFPDKPSVGVDMQTIQAASERLGRVVEIEIVDVAGTLRGVTRETGVFDLRKDGDELITGYVSDSFTEEDFDKVHGLTNQSCIATIQITRVTSISGVSKSQYVLLDAR